MDVIVWKFFIFCIKIFDFDLKNFLDRYMDRILTFFVIIITFLSIFQKKLEIDISYQTIILIIISFILIYRIPLLNFFLENFDEISIGNTRLKLKNIQKEIQKLEENGILDKDLKDIDEIRNKDETFLYGKFLLNFAKIEILLNNIIEKDFAIKKFTLKMLKDKYRQIFIKYKSKTLENLFLIFIEMVKFRNQIVHNGIEEKYEKEELHQIFIDFINIEEKIILKLEE
ncbi:hypothetical protein ACO1GV_03270 [Fusobacterium watanabei]|uniref:hypothetical protein n=1 Tax=Fusobacterium TaxID=848 RepID=UPI0030D07B0F